MVIPVLNEEGSVANLHRELITVLNNTNHIYEIIFVDDGSRDATVANLVVLSPVKLIKFRRNFGQTAALDAGIKAAQGELIVTLDGDGQNDPADIPNLIAELERVNADAVVGWRKNRQDPFLKRVASKVAAVIRKVLINDGVHDSGCTLKIFRRECFDHLDLSGEMHRFIPALLRIKGFKVAEIIVNHRPRKSGVTKYTWKRGVKGILDMLSIWFWKKYASRPLHLFGGVGLMLISLSIFGSAVALYQKFIIGTDLSNTALTNVTLFTFLAGLQFFVFGLLADLLSKNYFAVTRDTPYDIKEVVERK